MTPILDIHTHHTDAGPDAIISVEPSEFAPQPGHLYSVGHHPWNGIPQSLDDLTAIASHPQVVAIGETGLDSLRGAPLEEQVALFKQHIYIAQQQGKPIVAHMVRTAQPLVKAWRDIQPQGIALIVHGMRGNANVARPLVDAGCYLSYGEHFNPDALRATPLDRILAETDESPLAITRIIESMAHVLNMPATTLTAQLQHNACQALKCNLTCK